MLRQLLGEIYGTMLTAGASERYHQVRKTTPLILRHAHVNQRKHMFKIFLHALFGSKVVNYHLVFAVESAEPLFAPRIRQAPRIEDEAAAVARCIGRQFAVVREAKNANC